MRMLCKELTYYVHDFSILPDLVISCTVLDAIVLAGGHFVDIYFSPPISGLILDTRSRLPVSIRIKPPLYHQLQDHKTLTIKISTAIAQGFYGCGLPSECEIEHWSIGERKPDIFTFVTRTALILWVFNLCVFNP